ncbi:MULTISPECIES: pilus assembly protein [unclassified Sphingomonas]|uniref:pilus assembly protein n=1 Tax=unclassified Sphingomonas TaxID=196159 RepID=UPI000BC3D0BB|nr:MAG: hypothetical protein B7Z43_07025 [Sphingomonas sp. 12-62-6]OYX38101.1 MAG: hypothetical protein B7Y98_09705 [Sphingomonas sp. 32-62-10]
MADQSSTAIGQPIGFLRRLGRDVRGNTLAIMAAALIPLAGLVGGGIDMSRMYITKTRLQHACDAGALAGRKAMGGGIWSQNNNAPRTTAERFFDANISSTAYGSTELTRTFTESNGKVTGTVSATVPMTLTRVIGKTTETLTIVCDAAMSLPNTDIMFVLDVTGSMGNKAVSTDSKTKIQALRGAVKCFYESVAQRNTSETCTTGAPTGGVTAVQVRFGFVPYSVNVNVGKLLPTAYFADDWTYQSREKISIPGTAAGWTQVGNPSTSTSNVTFNNTPSAQCNDTALASKGSSSDAINGNSRVNTTIVYTRRSWSSKSGGQCKTRKTTTTTNYTGTNGTPPSNTWHYGEITHDVSALKNGTNWNNSFVLPIGTGFTNKTITWDGCIEERETVRETDYDPIPADANDLNIDLVPNSGDESTLWAPLLPGLIYTRQDTSGNGSNWNLADITTTTEYGNGSDYYCPAESRKLAEWNDPTAFENYVNSLSPTGNTYHDIGMLWGARLMSPTGIFASENALTPSGGEIERHLIFMTDGEACTGVGNYTAYGVSWFDRRQTDPNTVPTDGCNTSGTLTQQVNARLAGLCSAVKNKNITLWVIWFGASNTTIENSLRACATSGRFYSARNQTDLDSTFGSIASEISQLRLTR